MKTTMQLTICSFVLLAACSSPDKARLPAISANYAVAATIPTDNGFKQAPAGAVLKFLQWYRNNTSRLKKIELVSKAGTNGSAKYCTVNEAGTEQYLDELQKSGFVSEDYITKWRSYFEKCSEHLKKTPQTQTPDELTMDFVMLAKDCDEDLSHIEKATVESQNITNDKGSVTLGLPTAGRIKYKIVKQDGKWLIDDIKDMRSALDQAQND